MSEPTANNNKSYPLRRPRCDIKEPTANGYKHCLPAAAPKHLDKGWAPPQRKTRKAHHGMYSIIYVCRTGERFRGSKYQYQKVVLLQASMCVILRCVHAGAHIPIRSLRTYDHLYVTCTDSRHAYYYTYVSRSREVPELSCWGKTSGLCEIHIATGANP